jgi:hypothetical protein
MLNFETRHDGGQFLRAGGILLGHLVHLGHRLIELINALGLLLGSSGNLPHQLHDLLGTGADLLKIFFCDGHHISPCFDFFCDVVQETTTDLVVGSFLGKLEFYSPFGH